MEVKVKRVTGRVSRENTVMNNNPISNERHISERIAIVNSIIARWKDLARRNFINTHPILNLDDFEQHWPQVLANFFLAETIRVARALELLSDDRDN